jgi:hypothetical protein
VDDLLERVLASGELWGTTGRYQTVPTVKAYDGELPAGVAGFEFVTDAVPDLDGAGRVVRWTAASGHRSWTDSAGVPWVAISVIVTRVSGREP